MIEFLRSIQIELTSFWFGFLTATVFWLLFARFRPRLAKIYNRVSSQVSSTSQSIRANIENRHRSDTLKHAQGNHLASALFSLDEILIPPRLLAPLPVAHPDEDPPDEDVAGMSIPHMPDWPEMASAYYGHTISVEEAISSGINLAIVGPPGSGKTTTLGYLASELARKKIDLMTSDERIPFLIHAADLIPSIDSSNLLEGVAKAVAIYSSPLSTARLPNFTKRSFESNRAFLLIDGLDELPMEDFSAVIDLIWDIFDEYPQIQIVVSADANSIGNLPNIGFVSMPLAIWGSRQQAQFARKWGNTWARFIDPELRKEPQSITHLLLNGWILNRHSAMSPLELTLRLWAMYAGDVRGPTFCDTIEAYLLRMTAGIPKSIDALERIASQALNNQKGDFSNEEAESWIQEILPDGMESEEIEGASEKRDDIILPRILPDLSKNGLLEKRAGERFSFNHIVIEGYLAGRTISGTHVEPIFAQPFWPLKTLSIQYLSSHQDISQYANILLARKDDPLLLGPISISRWLREIPIEMTWRRIILGRLSNFLSEESIPLGARARILSGLANTNDPDISALFRHLLKSRKPSVRQLAALGSGYQRDSQAVKALIRLLGDQPEISRSAALALCNIGTQPALEALATALLQGSEEVRRAAAEAFANHPQEGHPTLREAVQLEDLLVRRAAIFGLKKIQQPWAMQILEEMQIEDAQWVVKNAAAQATEELNNPDTHIPQALPAINEIPWLVAIAEDRDMSISSVEAAWKMLITILNEGSQDDQLTALNLFRRFGYAEIFPIVFDQLQGENLKLREAAYQTTWKLASMGAEIPSPSRYGLA